MHDVQQQVRTAYYQLLNGNLTSNSNPVPIGDELRKFLDTENIYVILSSQSGVNDSNFRYFGSTEDIVIDIVFKAASRANKQVLDDVANQILNLVFPTDNPSVNNLPTQSGAQFLNVQLKDSRYMNLSLNNSSTVIRRLLTFRQTIVQN